jgi:CheY-like chemotaxis protein/HPt (histidine-containing phosphotransfer) domain-containing protein
VWSDDDTLHFSVTDSGIGMSQDVLDRLFKPFEQADSSISRRFGGTGLGLHISWSLCELMEGTIEVESDVDSGSKFELILPYHPSNLVEMSEGDIDAKKLPYLVKKFSGNVLIAEDSAALQILERRMVETVGCTVTIANNGSEAVELAAYNSFDLILMDMQMPVMDGIEATATLRQLDIQTPIVALTANVMPQHRDQFKKAGCNHFVDKPIDMAALQQVFENYLTPASKEEEATTVAPALANHSEVIDDELIDIFVTYTKTQLDELKQAYATLSWEEIRGIAHTVKGNGTSFGHPELTEQGAKVCDLIYQQAWTQLPDQMELLISFMEQAITHP